MLIKLIRHFKFDKCMNLSNYGILLFYSSQNIVILNVLGLLKDNQSLKEAKIVKGTKVMLIGASIADIEAARKKVKVEDSAKTSTTIKKEPLCEQKMHKKVFFCCMKNND